jgi:hypothetical protein
MGDAKLQLSAEEMRLVTDPGWILTKNSIISKVVALFAGLGSDWREIWEGKKVVEGGLAAALAGAGLGMPLAVAGAGSEMLRAVSGAEPKISKGENYKGLPYVMLDYPRVFGRADIFAIRTMFWWGYAFSVTLHLKGKYKDMFLPVIRERAAELSAAGFEMGVSEDEWEHAHTPETYRPFTEENIALPFLKLSARCGLEHWEEAPERLSGQYRVLLRVLSGVAGS